MSWNITKVGSKKSALLDAVMAESMPASVKSEICLRIEEIFKWQKDPNKEVCNPDHQIVVQSYGHLGDDPVRPYAHVDTIMIRVNCYRNVVV